MNTSLEKIKAAHENFEKVQMSLTKYGAGDTEPDFVYQDQIRQALEGKPYQPLTADQWQLYTASRKCDGAAKRLNAATQKVVNVIATTKVSELNDVMTWAQQTLWRVF